MRPRIVKGDIVKLIMVFDSQIQSRLRQQLMLELRIRSLVDYHLIEISLELLLVGKSTVFRDLRVNSYNKKCLKKNKSDSTLQLDVCDIGSSRY